MNWWTISAGIVMVGYAYIAGVVFVPGIDYPHPTLAQQVPVLVAGTASRIGPRVGRVEVERRENLSHGVREGLGQVPT